MKAELNTDALKLAGGAIIVAAAAYIVMPDLVRYVLGLWRLALFILAIVIVARVIAMMKIKITQRSAATAGRQNGEARQQGESGAEAAGSENGEERAMER